MADRGKLCIDRLNRKLANTILVDEAGALKTLCKSESQEPSRKLFIIFTTFLPTELSACRHNIRDHLILEEKKTNYWSGILDGSHLPPCHPKKNFSPKFVLTNGLECKMERTPLPWNSSKLTTPCLSPSGEGRLVVALLWGRQSDGRAATERT